MGTWKEYEELAARIYRELEPRAKVVRNDRIQGIDSGQARQIDVSIRATIAGHALLVIVQAKHLAEPADINVVGEFASVIRDVRASKGVLICSAGFTKGAIQMAGNYQIDLCTIHDAQSRDWKLDLAIPVLWIDQSPRVDFVFSAHFNAGDSIPSSPLHCVFSPDRGGSRLNILGTFTNRWNQNMIPRTPGKLHVLAPEQKDICVLVNDKKWQPVATLELRYLVEQHAWIKYHNAEEYRGIRHCITQDFVPTYLKLGAKAFQRDESWRPVSNPEEVIVQTKGILITCESPMLRVEDAKVSELNMLLLEPD